MKHLIHYKGTEQKEGGLSLHKYSYRRKQFIVEAETDTNKWLRAGLSADELYSLRKEDGEFLDNGGAYLGSSYGVAKFLGLTSA